jgi:hypothetical protein
VYRWFLWGYRRERDHLGAPGIDGRIILRCVFMKWDGDMYGIDLAQGRDRWQALVKVVMDLWVQ